VSTPLSWDEVTEKLDPRAYTIKTVPERIAKRGDLLKGLLGADLDVGSAGREARRKWCREACESPRESDLRADRGA